MSRKNGMCVMSFALFCPGITVSENTSSSHYAVAVVKGQESYQSYRDSFSGVWDAINDLHCQGYVIVDDETYNLNVFLAAYYKFLLLVLGMGGATSAHACIQSALLITRLIITRIRV